DRVVDPGGRDGCRAPIPWTADASDGGGGHGWAGEPWLPWPPAVDAHNLDVQRADPASTANLYRRLLAARRGSAALHAGGFEVLDLHDGVLAYRRLAPEG